MKATSIFKFYRDFLNKIEDENKDFSCKIEGDLNFFGDIKLNANLMRWGGVFNVARYLTDSLRGPVLQTLRPAHEVREFDGTGRTGRTVTKSVL